MSVAFYSDKRIHLEAGEIRNMYAKGISIVMPCLNEERTLGICIDKALKSMYPGVMLMALGFFFTIMIYIQPIRFGAIQLESTTMLYSAIGMLIGFQMIQFSVFTDIFGSMIGQFPRNKGISNRISIFMNQKGYLIAFILSIIGSIGILASFIAWAQTGFGELNTTWVCRTTVTLDPYWQ